MSVEIYKEVKFISLWIQLDNWESGWLFGIAEKPVELECRIQTYYAG